MSYGMLGKTVLYHLTALDQGKAGGRHIPSTEKNTNVTIAPAIVTQDLFPEDKKPHVLGLKVMCDSLDTLWIQSAKHGPGNGEWEFLEPELNQFPADAIQKGKERLNKIIEMFPSFGVEEMKILTKLSPNVHNTQDLGKLTHPEFHELLEKLKEEKGQNLNITT